MVERHAEDVGVVGSNPTVAIERGARRKRRGDLTIVRYRGFESRHNHFAVVGESG